MPSSINLIGFQKEIAVHRCQSAFKAVFVHFYHPMVGFSRSITGSEEVAKEIFSDVMLKIWKLGLSLESITNLKSYLYTAIKNESLNHLARAKRVKMVSLNDIPLNHLPIGNADHDLIVKELNHAMHLSIKALPTKCQLVFKLIREDRLSYKEVAEALDISVNTVEGHMTNALAKLKKAIQFFLKPSQN